MHTILYIALQLTRHRQVVDSLSYLFIVRFHVVVQIAQFLNHACNVAGSARVTHVRQHLETIANVDVTLEYKEIG